jgi:hypothetical protein
VSLALPVDACPFSRPFSVAFADCGAYEGAGFADPPTANTRLWTCRHLTVGRVAVGRYYPKCSIGGREDRRMFVRVRGKPTLD